MQDRAAQTSAASPPSFAPDKALLWLAGQTASTESLQDTLALETITGVSSTSYWNANLSEFANAELAPLLNSTDGNRSSIEAGQVTVSGESPSAFRV